MSETARSIKPLEGIRVLDFSRILSGPMGTMVLADLGAHVIKVEDLEGSDVTRHNPPYVNGESHYFLSLNRNKESLSIDLKKPEGRAIALALVEQSDVVVENFRPGVADRIGLGYQALSALNPGLVYCSVSGFGQTGPLRDKTAYDLVIQAMTGAMAVTGEPDRPPVKMGLPLADELSAMFSVIGILAALQKRARTGRGSYLDVSMFDVGVSLLSYMANIYFATGESARRLGSRHPTIYPYNAFQTRDGHIVVAAFTQAFWRKFCKAVGRDDLPADSRFVTFAGTTAALQGRQYGQRAENAAGEVAGRQPDAHRRTPFFAGDGHGAGHRLVDQVEGDLVRQRPGLAIAGDRALDDARIDATQFGA